MPTTEQIEALEEVKQRAKADIANTVILPNGKNNKRAIARILKYLMAAYEKVGLDEVEAGDRASNFIILSCEEFHAAAKTADMSDKPLGRPAEMDGGERKNVYLDAASVAIAAQLGEGNVSEGIRRALEIAAEL